MQLPPEDVRVAEETLKVLATRDEPLVVRLQREPGRGEVRWAQLLAGPASALQSGDFEPEPGGTTSPAGDQQPVDPAEPRPELTVTELLVALRADVTALGRALDHILARLNRR